ncbi:unnamed protein product [Acanthoscelides obtectus]|uniref:RNA-directed DNA polymerase n=1 Tax=Acanthoscelides obtectus TaxID=200917 RepID=A0A9P0JY61_ACAOB|nr:unnamed protein product [Acanthoscelides obtectus]CAK1663481.1 Uncharacterized protein K02A2.6 [Acanthoscelides obtectus]
MYQSTCQSIIQSHPYHNLTGTDLNCILINMRIPIPLEAKIENKIEELKQRDIIEPVVGSSKWVSPVVPVLKENGEEKTNIADSLSRLSRSAEKSLIKLEDNHICQIVEFARPRAVSLKEIIDSSMDDREIRNVKEGLYRNIWNDDVKLYKIFQNELCFHEGILLRGMRILVPSALRKRVLDAAHEGHPGIVSMKARLRTKVWWPRCDKEAENTLKIRLERKFAGLFDHVQQHTTFCYGKNPIRTFLQKEVRDKLPMVNDTMERTAQDTEVKDRDQERKQIGKEKGDMNKAGR